MPDFLLPDLGEGLTEAEVMSWLVEVGDEVVIDQPVVEVETAKASVEVPVPFAGVVTVLHARPGDVVAVGTPLITVSEARQWAPSFGGLREPGVELAPEVPVAETPLVQASAGSRPGGQPAPAADGRVTGAAPAAPSVVKAEPSPSSQSDAPEGNPAAVEGSGSVLVGYGTSGGSGTGSARRRRPPRKGAAIGAPVSGTRAAEPGDEVFSPGATGPTGQLGAPNGSSPHSSEVAVFTPDSTVVRVISPLVRRMAREARLDLRRVTGSGPDGLIMRADIQQAIEARPSAESSAQSASAAVDEQSAGYERIVLTGVRRFTAEKLVRSRREIPEATIWVDADATQLLEARAAINASLGRAGSGGTAAATPATGSGTAGATPGSAVSLVALLARFTIAALRRHPELNATVEDGEIHQHHAVHLGFAAQTDRGLVVPVVHHADRLSTRRLSAAIGELTDRARRGVLQPADLTGGTVTVNNYGVFGTDGAAAIINHPEAAILGLGRIIERPWVVDGQLAVRKVTQLTLSFDHRVCDGATAGGFLRFVADCVERPVTALSDL
ncbi:dihydrolipoamide acetyltransferase family protein [Kineosporia succinea]|uniref:Dihydrolipoamide acetyltransferase component of pyruvate dehydrogenase complex n=1 Tax=Kineosporia succinea TaxID=84632 RepID=A0ABT9P921_9ACTN|nr:dihydrolipoamide acetyltransferase family protein [Kineosporia succinea]MDP9829197.1 pyruvate dehydrogenase E2 component (dihydrolipoamide acetyltransferase) [Kineosporia succinea]